MQIGDIRKFYQESNDSPTGGGARDLRISPARDYWPELESFFPRRINDRSRAGKIISRIMGQDHIAEINLMGPTEARPNECRICIISKILAWNIPREEFVKNTQEGHRWIYLLVQDDQDSVWASKFNTKLIDEMDVKVAQAIHWGMSKSKNIRGIIHY